MCICLRFMARYRGLTRLPHSRAEGRLARGFGRLHLARSGLCIYIDVVLQGIPPDSSVMHFSLVL